MEEQKLDQRGRFKECTSCKYKFKFQTKDEKIKWKLEKYRCPSCGVEYCSIHETDRKLLKIQEQYFLSGRNERYINEMYPILYNYTKSIILKSFRGLIKSPEHMNDSIQSIITIFFEAYYLTRTNGVEYSFGGLLFRKAQQVLLTEHEKSPIVEGKQIETISLDFKLEDGKQVDYEDSKPSLFRSIENEKNKELICRYLADLIIEIKFKCNNPRENYLRLQALYLYLYRGENKVSKFFEVYNREGKYMFEQTLNLMKEELHKLYQ